MVIVPDRTDRKHSPATITNLHFLSPRYPRRPCLPVSWRSTLGNYIIKVLVVYRVISRSSRMGDTHLNPRRFTSYAFTKSLVVSLKTFRRSVPINTLPNRIDPNWSRTVRLVIFKARLMLYLNAVYPRIGVKNVSYNRSYNAEIPSRNPLGTVPQLSRIARLKSIRNFSISMSREPVKLSFKMNA